MNQLSQIMSNISTQANRFAGKPDAINSEFLYYSSVLKVLAPALTGESDRKMIIPWVRKLFRPEYHSSQFREKRNKYLLFLTITLLNDESYGIFRTFPPEKAIPDIESIHHEPIPAAEWENDEMWRETLLGLPDTFQSLICTVHDTPSACAADHKLDTILDQEFQFFLYLARPYAAMLNNPDDRTRIAAWLQTLCTIHGDFCSSMRAIRNDYMMALLGYIHDLRVTGPFKEYPPWSSLPPLAEAARLAAETKPLTDPTGPDASEFLATQPVPEDGAFCYIAITGDLISSSFGPM
ncbi:hypothetical protein ILUMI_27125 [Ignelater luminosus]|uniref:DUF4485 domain-containing protein n=1 Tax=Ignelater luminosus TaxID=2038154 RepID=A0A8K0FY05_IGNLU|nr:hypothetical protein ILUMI_27125 [Ignelater luminosus]